MAVIGMIGAGNWGSNWVRTLACLPGAEFRYCCDLREKSLERVRRQFPQVKTTCDVSEVLADREVDGVVIATDAHTHFPLARQALQAGKDVLVEKPMTLTSQEGLALTELAHRRRRVLMVGHLLEYHPAIHFLKQMIDSGELGDIFYIYSQRLNLGTVRRDENAWWSLAPHDVSVACSLLQGRPLSVQCRGQNALQEGIADVIFAALEFPGGTMAHIHVSWLDPHKTRKLTVVGSRRMVVFDDTLASHKITIYDKGFQINEGFSSFADWISLRHGDIVIPPIDMTEPLQLEARHFVECIQTRARPLTDGHSGLRVVSVLEQGQRSLDLGGAIMRLPLEANTLVQSA